MFPMMMVYLVLVIIRPQDYPELQGAIPLPLQQVALLLAGVAWLMSGRRMNSAPQNLLLLLFMLAMMLSVAVNGWIGGAVPIFRDFAPVVLAYFLLCNATFTASRLRIAMAVFCLCATVLAVHGIEQAALGTGWTGMKLSQGTRIQYVGIFSDPNDLGMLFVICVPMAMYLAQLGGWLGLRRLFWWVIAATLVYGIYLTDSRGTVLALLAVFGIYLWRSRGLLVAGTLGAGALVVLMALPSRMQELEVGEESAMDRVYSWYEGMQMFKDNPIWGVGKGAYTDIYQLTAHNSLVLVLAEMGIVGFTLWLMFMGYCFWMMVSIVKWRPTRAMLQDEENFGPSVVRQWTDDRAIAFVLLLSLSAFAVCAFFLSRTYVSILYLLAALVVAHYSMVRRRYPWVAEMRISDHLLAWPFLSAAAAVAMYIVVRILLVMA
ncbi:O-antigen ligase family protein [Pseudoxanthomonas sp. SL93]|jgi:O-antigen ligase|uniref:O-antigen ligase family protein n=1 Tax=Pseudoxanthomonas sp. SL93 TaxID=2995142 RepID=UPI00226EF26C|nr:O-antigen ligase family protein [Pseudoxanthomonas sp. SL93]WAC63508.1 O-antigen ligase family protein [Pseudoxanthomonas sp. SL93]